MPNCPVRGNPAKVAALLDTGANTMYYLIAEGVGRFCLSANRWCLALVHSLSKSDNAQDASDLLSNEGYMEARRCSRCGRNLPVSMFAKNSEQKGGLRTDCRDCNSATTAAWKVKNLDKVSANRKRYFNGKGKLYHREYKRDKLHNDPAYKARKNTHERNRKTRKYNAGSLEYSQWMTLISFFDSCPCCREKVESFSIEHIVPVSRGGTNDITNIQPLCQKCNNKKGIKTKDYRPPHVKAWTESQVQK